MEEVIVDSTCGKAHKASAGARKTHGFQAMGITHGGLNTKIHALCGAQGNPPHFLAPTAQLHDFIPAPQLLDGVSAEALLADKGP